VGVAQEVAEEVPVVGVHDGFGQLGEVEEEDVPGLAELARVVQSPQELPRMGHVEDGQPVDDLRVAHRSVPGEGSAPVMTGQQRRLGPAFVDETADVGGQLVGVVGMDAVRLGGQVVAAHVGGDDAESRRRERLDLQPPAVPELREAVQQHDQRPLAGLDVMQPHLTEVGVAVAQFGALEGCDHHRRNPGSPRLPPAPVAAGYSRASATIAANSAAR
jgi:hypothetical protein